MKRNRSIMFRLLALALALVMALPLVGGCAKKAEPAAPPRVLNVAALKGPTGMGLAYVMRERQEDFSVALYDAPDGVTAKLINGEVDIAAVPLNLASVLYNKTQGGIVMLGVNTLGVLYIVEQGDSVRSMADLSGKTIYATGQGSTPEFILNALLAQYGVTDAKVEYVGEHAALAAMVASGEAKLAMLPEPNVSSVLLKNENVRVALNLTEAWDAVSDAALVQGCYVARRSVYEAEGAAVDAFIEAAADSARRVNSEEGAAALIAELGIVGSEAIARAAIPRANIVCMTGADMEKAASAMLQVLYAANPASVGGALPGRELYGN